MRHRPAAWHERRTRQPRPGARLLVTPVSRGLPAAGVLLVAALAGCASYRPLPLPRQPDLLPRLPITNTASGGLDLTALAQLAVGNNPDLRARRAALGVARAEVYAAGLLPDPQLSIGRDRPTTDTAGLVDARGLGLAYDFGALFTRATDREAARETQVQVRLELTWAEWQTAQRARELGLVLWTAGKQLELLDQAVARFQRRQAQSAAALAAGDTTLLVAGPDLTALLDATSRRVQATQTLTEAAHQLRALLGLAPQVPLTVADPLLAGSAYAPIRSDTVRQALTELPKRRPDLRALAAAYAAQEARVRASVLAQFPAVTLGLTRANDTSAIYTSGLSIGLNLPLFSGARGQIAQARATRRQLGAEYQARLDRTQAEVMQLVDLAALLTAQHGELACHLPSLQTLVEQARVAHGRGDMDALVYLNLEQTLTAKQLEQLDLTKQLASIRVALDTLLGLPLGAVQTP